MRADQTRDTVVTYCFVGMRASVTYLAARAIGLVAKMYDGSYQDWSHRHLPLSRAVERWKRQVGRAMSRNGNIATSRSRGRDFS